MSYVYLLVSTKGNTYVGATVDLNRRLRQHNKEIKGGAHATDTANAFKCILEKGKIGEIYNIGCDSHLEYSVIDIANILIKKIKLTDKYDEWIEYIEDRPFNDKRYYISNEKVKKLGWEIKKDFMEGLDELI